MSSSYYLFCTATQWKIYSRLLCFNSSQTRCLLWLDSTRLVETALIGRLPHVEPMITAVSHHEISPCQTKRSWRCYAARDNDDQDHPPWWWCSRPPSSVGMMPIDDEVKISLDATVLPVLPVTESVSTHTCILLYCRRSPRDGWVPHLTVFDGASWTRSLSTSGYIASTVGDLFVPGVFMNRTLFL